MGKRRSRQTKEQRRQHRKGALQPTLPPTTMEADSQEIQVQRRGSWAQYADCKNMSRFSDLRTSEEGRQPCTNVEGQIPDKTNETERKQKTNASGANTTPKTLNIPLVDSSEAKPRFGHPSSSLHDRKTPDRAPCPSRSLEDLYLENPEKKLQTSIDPATMNAVASVVLHVATESGYQWFNKWCPHMDLQEVFESIAIKGNGGELTDKKYNVSPDAIDTRGMKTTRATTLAELYRECHNVHPKGSGDIGFPKLLKLIDQCAIFVGVLKDDERKVLLRQTRSMFQWIPIALDGKKLYILNEARGTLKALNKEFNYGDSKLDLKASNRKRKAGECGILDTITADFDIHRKTFESQMLEQLKVLLASTARSPPKANYSN
ncbi:hypothetical protein O1611_g8375 [Lasiodiplodia mahajangana]|uniref:Uncharacterized protein n=1 Tax=Lasiodiplodia mahajangana TaxID=1108764 RepID=A0ACC2JDH0_9PEZI|nr:hypothetical protein O1611_g8375 [Lasiodiplodia mahajangana]